MSSWYWWTTLLVITFVSRWWPRLVRPEARDSDTYYHLLQAENIRNHRFRLPRRHPQFVLPGEYAYPPGYHYLLALFPKKAHEEFEKISSALFDTLLVVVFLWLATAELQPAIWSTSSLFLLGLAFALSPALVGIGTGPRAYQGTPRTLGELMAAVVFGSLWQYWSGNSWIWMLISILVGSLMLNTSKFSGQVLLFFSCLMAFLLNSATLLVFPPLCVVGAIVVSKGHYYRVLMSQIGHLRLYANRIADSHPTTQARKRWVWPRNLRELRMFFLYENVYAILVIKFTVVLFALGMVAWSTFSRLGSAERFLVAWLLSALGVFAVVSMPSFLFLGEADRYLEYALIPAFLLSATQSGIGYRYYIIVGFVALHVALYVLHVGLFFRRCGRTPVSDLSELIDFLGTQEPRVILSLLGGAPYELAYRTDQQVLFSESLAKAYAEEEYDRFFWRYPLPRPDFRHYVEEYGLGLIAVSKRVVEASRKEGCVYVFTGLDKVFENDAYLLYSVPKGYINDFDK